MNDTSDADAVCVDTVRNGGGAKGKAQSVLSAGDPQRKSSASCICEAQQQPHHPTHLRPLNPPYSSAVLRAASSIPGPHYTSLRHHVPISRIPRGAKSCAPGHPEHLLRTEHLLSEPVKEGLR